MDTERSEEIYMNTEKIYNICNIWQATH